MIFLYRITEEADWTVLMVSFVPKFIKCSLYECRAVGTPLLDLRKFPTHWKENNNFAISPCKPQGKQLAGWF